MLASQDPEIVALADQLYVKSKDDDARLAELIRELPRDTAIELCTSNLTNALQAYIYAFDTIPDEDLYDLLLLRSSAMIKRGVKIESVEDLDIIFYFDKTKREFCIAVREDQTVIKEFGGKNALDLAREYVATRD